MPWRARRGRRRRRRRRRRGQRGGGGGCGGGGGLPRGRRQRDAPLREAAEDPLLEHLSRRRDNRHGAADYVPVGGCVEGRPGSGGGGGGGRGGCWVGSTATERGGSTSDGGISVTGTRVQKVVVVGAACSSRRQPLVPSGVVVYVRGSSAAVARVGGRRLSAERWGREGGTVRKSACGNDVDKRTPRHGSGSLRHAPEAPDKVADAWGRGGSLLAVGIHLWGARAKGSGASARARDCEQKQPADV